MSISDGSSFLINEGDCCVGRTIVRRDMSVEPCPNVARHRLRIDDDGHGSGPFHLLVCSDHIEELAPSKHRVETQWDPAKCMSGRQLTGLPGWESECPEDWTEVVHVAGVNHPDGAGGLILHLCIQHVLELEHAQQVQ